MRVGMGYDVHKLVEGRKLILGGVEIPYEKGLLGHSDADVMLHAVMDALLGAAALGAIYATIFSSNITMSINPVAGFAIICAVGALISMVGDLAASAIKRNHDIKDYGKLIPGHGGIMDRFDSVIYVAPVIWILLQIFLRRRYEKYFHSWINRIHRNTNIRYCKSK